MGTEVVRVSSDRVSAASAQQPTSDESRTMSTDPGDEPPRSTSWRNWSTIDPIQKGGDSFEFAGWATTQRTTLGKKKRAYQGILLNDTFGAGSTLTKLVGSHGR